MTTLKLETYINAPLAICFDLSRSVDVHKASTAHTEEIAVAGRVAGLSQINDTITWRAKHFGIVQHLTVRITKLDYPYYFQDKMVEGAFKGFTHDHYFTDQNGLTLMKDVFTYSAPFGLIGKLVESLFLDQYMYKFLQKRNAAIKEYAETDRWRSMLNR